MGATTPATLSRLTWSPFFPPSKAGERWASAHAKSLRLKRPIIAETVKHVGNVRALWCWKGTNVAEEKQRPLADLHSLDSPHVCNYRDRQDPEWQEHALWYRFLVDVGSCDPGARDEVEFTGKSNVFVFFLKQKPAGEKSRGGFGSTLVDVEHEWILSWGPTRGEREKENISCAIIVVAYGRVWKSIFFFIINTTAEQPVRCIT